MYRERWDRCLTLAPLVFWLDYISYALSGKRFIGSCVHLREETRETLLAFKG